jgi:hypothetical protein
METVMINEVRDTSGKFAPKSEVPRKVRSVNLTEDAWQWLATVAEKAGVSRNDYLEALAESSNPFMETVQAESYPFMETAHIETEFEWQFDIFWCSPTSTASEGGRLCQGGKEKFVTRLAFRRARVEGRNEEF